MADGFLSPSTNLNQDWAATWNTPLKDVKVLSPDTSIYGNKLLSPDIQTSLSGEITLGDKSTSTITKKSVYYAPINIIGSPNASSSPSFSDSASSGQSGGSKSLIGLEGVGMPLLLLGGAALLVLIFSGGKK